MPVTNCMAAFPAEGEYESIMVLGRVMIPNYVSARRTAMELGPVMLPQNELGPSTEGIL